MPRRDIGVALPLPEPFNGELQTWRERLGDPNARQIPPHITLLPPTTLQTEDLDEVEEHLRAIAARERSFVVHLSGTGTFRPLSPVVFVSIAQGAAECARLERQVRHGPLARALSYPYHPHVTVAHDLDDEALDRAEESLEGYEARWRVWGFTMFERGADSVWRPQRDFPFAGDVGPLPEEG
ncbi:MAG TPA: 2'-5' RNA ligase family protein [Mycobacteriales bacterium]|nr:2'-5' RNA ligase family protein [Mycobacteriales bacterium]